MSYTSGLGECEHDMWQIRKGNSLFCIGIEVSLCNTNLNMTLIFELRAIV